MGRRDTYRQMADEGLMELNAEGDTEAFTELYDRWAGRLAHYFRKMLWQDELRAADMTQDLFAKIVERPDLYRSGHKFSTWLYSIANNMCKNVYRHHEVKERHVSHARYEQVNETAPAADLSDKNRFKQDLDQSLNELNHDQRSTFIMRHKQGLSIKEIAEVMDCSEGTVKSRLFYTMKKLAAELAQYDPRLG